MRQTQSVCGVGGGEGVGGGRGGGVRGFGEWGGSWGEGGQASYILHCVLHANKKKGGGWSM